MTAKVTGSKTAAKPRARASQGRPGAAARAMTGPPPRSPGEAAAMGLGPSVQPQRVPVLGAADDSAMDPGVFEFEPVRLTPVRDEDITHIPLFYIGDRAYTIPAQVGMETGLEGMHISRTLGMRGWPREEVEGALFDYIFENLLGEEGYAALRSFRGLSPEDFGKIAAIAYRMTLGALELPKDAGSE